MTYKKHVLCGLASALLFVGSAHAADQFTLGRDILKQLIEINSTHANGTTAAARAMAERLLAAGFPAADVTLVAPPKNPEMGNVVVRLRGRNAGKAVLFLGHLDVVEAKREDWNFNPFELVEKDGWLYGRGVIDMKGQDAAMLAALITLKREGFVPERDIIVALTADEEAGSVANGADYLFKEQRALVDAGLVINPDAGEAGSKGGRRLYVGAQSSEKMYLTFQLEATDKGGHSSRPTNANPIYQLARALGRVDSFAFPVHLTGTTTEYFKRRALLESGTMRADMLDVVKPAPSKDALKRLSANVETNIVLRTTCTTTMIEGGHAENALPQRARATIQCRVVPGESVDQVKGQLEHVIADRHLALTVLPGGMPSPETVITPAMMASIEGVVHSVWPGVAVLPLMSAGASDSVYTRALGVPTLGVDGMFDDLDDGRAHGRDERIGVQAFKEEISFINALMRTFSR
ncbi:MAG: M20/M25/M40 family metallo-hydrolase [Pseudomonadota bacterium]